MGVKMWQKKFSLRVLTICYTAVGERKKRIKQYHVVLHLTFNALFSLESLSCMCFKCSNSVDRSSNRLRSLSISVVTAWIPVSPITSRLISDLFLTCRRVIACIDRCGEVKGRYTRLQVDVYYQIRK